jgi:hypothetical protein
VYLTIHLSRVPRSGMLELYLHSATRLPDVPLNLSIALVDVVVAVLSCNWKEARQLPLPP